MLLSVKAEVALFSCAQNDLTSCYLYVEISLNTFENLDRDNIGLGTIRVRKAMTSTLVEVSQRSLVMSLFDLLCLTRRSSLLIVIS